MVDGSVASDAPSTPDANASPGCLGSLRFSHTEAETVTKLEALLADVRAVAPSAYYAEGPRGAGLPVNLTGINVTLDAPIGSDPRPAAIAWLAATSPTTFVADEWAIDPTEPPFDPAATQVVSRLIRTSAEGVPWPNDPPETWVEGGALSVFIGVRAGSWSFRESTVAPLTVLATADDAALLGGCQPTLPGPEETLRATELMGLEMVQCTPTGEYAYTPLPNDTTLWKRGQGWTLSPPVAGQRSWVPFVTVELTIDPANYWPTVNRCDCYCSSKAGFTYRVNPITGEVMRIVPSINCIVC